MGYNRPEEVMGRIEALSFETIYSTDKSFLHAYVARLSFQDLCSALLQYISNAGPIRTALKGRLLRVAKERCDVDELTTFVDCAIEKAGSDRKLAPTVDSICSAVFSSLPLPTQQQIMDRWIDRGTRGALARWLKMAEKHPHFFDEDLVFQLWRSDADDRLLRSLCLQASPNSLGDALVEIAKRGIEGWMVGRAFQRANSISAEAWDILRDTHLATFLYLCAKQGRVLRQEDAVELVLRLPAHQYPDVLGLGIWSLGQLGMYSALVELQARLAT